MLELPEKGRGRALRAAWSRSDADVLVYMDVDLSTDLRALLPLVAPLVSGHSDVAIGTRLADGARVVRGPKRELISRSYNRLLHLSLGARFSDAQCGFKAVRADVARRLLPGVRDEAGSSTPSCWSSPSATGCASTRCRSTGSTTRTRAWTSCAPRVEDLRGIARLLAGARAHALPGHRPVLDDRLRAALPAAARAARARPAGNALALALTAVANTQANRHFTFGVRGREEPAAPARAGLLRLPRSRSG